MLKERPQESALAIMHFQHVKGYSLIPDKNFSFLPHNYSGNMIQKAAHCSSREYLATAASAILQREDP